MKHWSIYFSYWIYFYFIAYYLKLIKYSPILLLILSCLNNFQNLFKQINNIKKNKVFILLLYLNLSIHFIPFLYLYNQIKKRKKQQNKQHNKKKYDYNKIIIFNLLLFVLYLFYINCSNLIMYNIYNKYDYEDFTLNSFIYSRFTSFFEFILFIILTIIINYYIFIS